MTSTETRVSVLEARLLHVAELLERHMEREEETTKKIMTRLDRVDGRLESIETRLTNWRGMAAGVGLVVSALWAALLALVTWLR